MTSSSERLAPRVDISLDVFLQTVDGDVPCKTRDVSYEGVFIVRPDPLPLRKLIRFRTRLPDGEEDLQMLGLVAHTVNATDAAEDNRDPGMGIQLFSLGKKTHQRWRDYIDFLYSENPEARRSIEEKSRPTVRLRIPNPSLLRRFRTVDLPAGKLFLRTPELHPEGTDLDCVVSHPLNDEEFILPAHVLECVDGTVKERGLRLALHLPEDTSALEEFLGGTIPAPAPSPPDDHPAPPVDEAQTEPQTDALDESDEPDQQPPTESDAEMDDASEAEVPESDESNDESNGETKQ